MPHEMFDQFQCTTMQSAYTSQGLYRGISTVRKKWVYGYLSCNKSYNLYFIQDGTAHNPTFEVYPQTLGMYTGKEDKTGRKIFSGDKIQWDTREDEEDYDVIEWYNKSSCWLAVNGYYGDSTLETVSECGTVIGTIFDELLECL